MQATLVYMPMSCSTGLGVAAIHVLLKANWSSQFLLCIHHHHAVMRQTEAQHWCATELVPVPARSLVSADIVHVCSGWLTAAVFLTADNV